MHPLCAGCNSPLSARYGVRSWKSGLGTMASISRPSGPAAGLEGATGSAFLGMFTRMLAVATSSRCALRGTHHLCARGIAKVRCGKERTRDDAFPGGPADLRGRLEAGCRPALSWGRRQPRSAVRWTELVTLQTTHGGRRSGLFARDYDACHFARGGRRATGPRCPATVWPGRPDALLTRYIIYYMV